MKHTILYLAMLAAAPAFVACSDDSNDIVLPPSLMPVVVTNHNISGTWQAVTWRGQTLPEGAYVRLTFVRRDQTFTMQQNLGSMYEQTFSGTFSLTQDEDTELWVLRGAYDYDGGSWAHDYYVTSLTATTMTLMATDDPSDVTLYQKL